MPPLPLGLTIQAALPWLGSESRAVVSALVAADGRIDSASVMASRLGMENRFRLARVLHRDGLPSFGRLADWVFVLRMVWEAEASRVSLVRVARRIGIEPATCYRRYKRRLGVPWTAARSNGFAWAFVRFLHACRRPTRGAPGRLHRLAGPQRAREGVGMSAAGSEQPDPTRSLDRSAARVMLGQAPTDVAISRGGAVYVPRAFAASVERLDLTTLRTNRSIPVGCNPTRIAFDHAGRRAYVSNQFSNSISVIDTATDHVVDELPVAGDPAPLVVAPDQRTLYVTTNLDVLYAIDLHSKRIVAEIPLPATSHHLTIGAPRGRLYVATRSAGIVLEIDTHTHSVARTFVVGGQAQAMAVEESGTELYVANEAGWVDVVNLESGALNASVRLEAGGYGLSLSPFEPTMYVTLPSLGRVSVIDRMTLRRAHSIQTGGMPRHTIFAHDGRSVIIVNEGGWLDVFAPGSPLLASARSLAAAPGAPRAAPPPARRRTRNRTG